jgi:membrane-associated phospholipid phosphatase
VLVTAIVWLARWLRDEDNRRRLRAWIDRQAQRPALRPLVRVLAPLLRTTRGPARFVWDRVTPGDLGLELTTVLAVAGVGAFVFVWNLVGVEQRDVLAGDGMSLRLADRLHADAAVSAAKVLTALGSLPVAIALVALAGIALVWQRAIRDAVALVLGLALTYAAVHITKDAVDRARPARALVDADGASYPSAHAAYAVTWVAVAFALSRALPTIASRFAFVTVAIVIAIVVGLTRIYLRAHYLSDVVGGWGLGAALFGLCGIVALVIGYVRNNARAHA